MSAYLISSPTIHNSELMKEYVIKSAPLLESYGGRYLAKTDQIEVLEGRFGGKRLVIMQFPDIDHVKRFWNSAEYRELCELRHAAADADIWMLPGLD